MARFQCCNVNWVGSVCFTCGALDPASCVPGAPAPTEPPEGGLSVRKLADAIRNAKAASDAVPPLNIDGVEYYAFFTTRAQSSPLDRALEAFVARRKAKREAADYADIEEIMDGIERHFLAELERAEPLARAMSAPLSFTARMGGRT